MLINVNTACNLIPELLLTVASAEFPAGSALVWTFLKNLMSGLFFISVVYRCNTNTHTHMPQCIWTKWDDITHIHNRSAQVVNICICTVYHCNHRRVFSFKTTACFALHFNTGLAPQSASPFISSQISAPSWPLTAHQVVCCRTSCSCMETITYGTHSQWVCLCG